MHSFSWGFFNDQGIPQSLDDAVKYFKLAAEQGHGGAQYKLDQIKQQQGLDSGNLLNSIFKSNGEHCSVRENWILV